MTYDTMNTMLLNRFPELTDKIETEIDWWKGKKIPTYPLYEGVLNGSRFLVDLLTHESNLELIGRVFDFFEEMAESDDFEVKNLLQVGILEYLWGTTLLDVAHKYMRPQTRKLSDELQIYFNP